MEVIALRKKARTLGCFLRKNSDERYVLLDTLTKRAVHGPKLTLGGVSEWISQQGSSAYAFINTRAGNNLMAADKGGTRYQKARKRYERFISDSNEHLAKETIGAEAACIVAEASA